MTKVALCFYGQPRYINNVKIPCAYATQFNEDNYHVDTFGHCWYKKDVIYSSSSWTQKHTDYKSNCDTIKKLYDYYKFKKLIIESPRIFTLPTQLSEYYKNTCSDQNLRFTETRENNTLSQLFSIQKVSRIVPDSYDFYVLCRYDTVIDHVPDLTLIDNDKLYLCNMGLFPDPIMVFGKKFLNWSRNQYDNAVTKMYKMDGFMPENFKMFSFLEHHTWNDVVHCNMWATIMRDE